MTKTNGNTRPDPFPYEFGGPVGALATTLALPVVVMWLLHMGRVGYWNFNFVNELCDDEKCDPSSSSLLVVVVIGPTIRCSTSVSQ